MDNWHLLFINVALNKPRVLIKESPTFNVGVSVVLNRNRSAWVVIIRRRPRSINMFIFQNYILYFFNYKGNNWKIEQKQYKT